MFENEKPRIDDKIDKSGIWFRVLRAALAIPGARISRVGYLKKELSKHFSDDVVQKAIETTPVKAGIPSSVIRSIASSSIKWHRAGVTGTSFMMGIPGKFLMAGTIPADLTQFFWHVIVIIQKLAYLHGWPDFCEDDAEPDDETLRILTIFVGVMFGVGSASKILADIGERLAGQMLKRLPQQALTKWGFYQVAKEIAKWIGIRLTKQGFARAVSKVIPFISGFASGTITWLWFSGMSRKLHKHLETLRPHLDNGQIEPDVSLKESDPNDGEADTPPGFVQEHTEGLVQAKQGLVDKSHWTDSLSDCPSALVLEIRDYLLHNVDELSEKFNRNSRYFGYSKTGGSDVLYIYVQKKRLRIDLNIDRKYEAELQQLGFTVNYVNNFQGRAGWLTGWQIPHDTKNLEIVTEWILKAFE